MLEQCICTTTGRTRVPQCALKNSPHVLFFNSLLLGAKILSSLFEIMLTMSDDKKYQIIKKMRKVTG